MKTNSILIIIIVAIGVILVSCSPKLEACFTFTTQLVTTGTDVTFNSSCSENATGYKWNFGEPGDNSKDTIVQSQTINHIYARPGNYTVTLDLISKCGTFGVRGNTTITQVITIQ
jgi:PKD repeat protein